MRHRNFHMENLYAYLERSGVLDSKDNVLIRKTKSLYWKEYRRLYKQAYRTKNKEVTARISHELFEQVQSRVKNLEITIPKYVEELIESDIDKRIVLGNPDSLVLAQTLSRIHSEIENLVRNHMKGTPAPYIFDEVLARIDYLESVVHSRQMK